MILVFGKQGQLAQSFQMTLPKELETEAVFISSHEADFQRPQTLAGFLDHYSPKIIIICSAYTQVDLAEQDRDMCERINHKAPREIARWCVTNDALLIHFSTDYVFNGHGDQPWKESDEPKPLNWYGETKWEGEMAIQDTRCKHLIFRTSWVYSEFGKNFVKTMLRLGKEKENLSVVGDQVGAPTYAPDIANAVWGIIQRYNKGEVFKSGLYHMTGSGYTNWADFAKSIFSQAEAIQHLSFDLKIKHVEAIKSADYQTIALRPLNSRLDQSKLKATFGIEMPAWQDSLNLCLKKLGAQQ